MMLPIKVFAGQKSLSEVVQWDTVDTVLGAILGFAGLHSILAAIGAGKRIAPGQQGNTGGSGRAGNAAGARKECNDHTGRQ